MALQTKTFKSSTVNYYHTELTITENSVNATDNTSSISYTLVLYAGVANFYDYSVGHVITLAGKTVSSAYRPNAPQYSVEKNSSVTIASGTTTVAHNDDGSLNMSIAFSISVYKTDYTPGDIAVSGQTMALTQIARASTIAATDANIEAVSTVSINKKSTAYSHSVKYVFGDKTGYLSSDGSTTDAETVFAAATVAWKIPASFYDQIPNAKNGTCTLTCTTYSGSTQIGNPSATTFTVTAAAPLCEPSVSGLVYDINDAMIALTGDSHTLIRFCSTARCVIEATAKNSATIAERRIFGVPINGTTMDVPNFDTTVVAFSATDSRGYAAYKSKSVPLVMYEKLTNNATCSRTDPTSGNATLTLSGAYFNGNFGAKSNELVLKYAINGGSEVAVAPTISNNAYSATVPLSGLDYTKSHRIVVTASDAVTTISSTITVKPGIPVFDWGETDFCFNVPLTVVGLAVIPAQPNAGSHNAIYRGKYLGAAVTAAQWAAIAAGTFDDLYIGDYWTIGGVNYRIAAFDYYYSTGDTACTTHHVVIVPDTALYTTAYNDDNVVTDGYVGSKLYTQGLASAKSTIGSAFGSTHILSHRQYLTNAADNGFASGGGWYNSTVELMTEQNVCGCKIFCDSSAGTTAPVNYTIDRSQYPLFAVCPSLITTRSKYWLRDIATKVSFCAVAENGGQDHFTATSALGVRPAFCIKG